VRQTHLRLGKGRVAQQPDAAFHFEPWRTAGRGRPGWSIAERHHVRPAARRSEELDASPRPRGVQGERLGMVALAGKAAVSPAPATPATLVDDSGRRVAGCLPADLNAPLADVTDDKRAEPDEIRLLVRRRRRRYDLRPHLLARVESSGPLVAVLDLPLDRLAGAPAEL